MHDILTFYYWHKLSKGSAYIYSLSNGTAPYNSECPTPVHTLSLSKVIWMSMHSLFLEKGVTSHKISLDFGIEKETTPWAALGWVPLTVSVCCRLAQCPRLHNTLRSAATEGVITLQLCPTVLRFPTVSQSVYHVWLCLPFQSPCNLILQASAPTATATKLPYIYGGGKCHGFPYNRDARSIYVFQRSSDHSLQLHTVNAINFDVSALLQYRLLRSITDLLAATQHIHLIQKLQ